MYHRLYHIIKAQDRRMLLVCRLENYALSSYMLGTRQVTQQLFMWLGSHVQHQLCWLCRWLVHGPCVSCVCMIDAYIYMYITLCNSTCVYAHVWVPGMFVCVVCTTKEISCAFGLMHGLPKRDACTYMQPCVEMLSVGKLPLRQAP